MTADHGPFTLSHLRTCIGKRVQLAPHTDLWMRGMRYGTIERVGQNRRSSITILGDNGRHYGLQPDMIAEVFDAEPQGE